MDIINEILKWPVIIQGALGSFLFWGIFTISQKLILSTTKKIKHERELGGFFGKNARDSHAEGNHNASNYSFFICIYGALHYFIKFTLSAFIGFVASDFIPVFGYVGYIMALYFGFRAISYVTHFDTFEKQDRKEKERLTQMNEQEEAP